MGIHPQVPAKKSALRWLLGQFIGIQQITFGVGALPVNIVPLNSAWRLN